MRFSRIFQGLRSAGPAEERLVRFRKVLSAAQHVPRYQDCLRRANLHSNRAIASVRCVDDALQHFAILDLEQFRDARDEFHSARAPLALPQKFFNPLSQPSRIAVIMDGFDEKGGVRIFKEEDRGLLQQYQPEIIAAPVTVLRRLAGAINDGSLTFPTLNLAIVAFTGQEETLETRDHDLFWRMFQVPMFEHYIGLDGRVVARECEIHEGLHLVEEHAVIEQHQGQELLLTSLTDFRRPTLRVKTGSTGTIEKTLCECGRVEPRVLALTPLEKTPLLSAAAAA